MFSPYVGEPSILKYGTTEDDAFILIPQYHPGYDKYDRQPTEFRQVLLRTWMVTNQIFSYMVDATEKSGPEESMTICESVIQAYRNPENPLPEQLKLAKANLDKKWLQMRYSHLNHQKNIQDQEVSVFKNGRVYMLWESPDGIIERVLIHGFTALIPVDSDMFRSIHFSENGISICREDKSVIKCREGQDVTWTKRQIAAMSNAEVLKRMWTFHTETPWTESILATTPEDTSQGIR